MTGCTRFTRHKHGVQSSNNSKPYRYKEKVKGIIPNSGYKLKQNKNEQKSRIKERFNKLVSQNNFPN